MLWFILKCIYVHVYINLWLIAHTIFVFYIITLGFGYNRGFLCWQHFTDMQRKRHGMKHVERQVKIPHKVIRTTKIRHLSKTK